jgi:hypothetical protein
MRKDWIIAALKFVAVLLIYFIPAWVIKKINASNENASLLSLPDIKTPGKEQYYFIGSSRTRRSVDDSLLNTKFRDAAFLNIGMDKGTFLFNKIIADKLLNDSDRKTLFIELSVINARLPQGYQQVVEDGNVLRSLIPMIKEGRINEARNIFWPVIEKVLLEKMRLGPSVKALFTSSTPQTALVGFFRTDSSSVVSPLFFQEKDTAYPGRKDILPVYAKMVDGLLQKASQANSRIIFVMPLACNSLEEKEVLLTVFNRIPVQNKLIYSEALLNQLHHPAFFSDKTHLNTSGSFLFTNYLADYIQGHGWLK